MPNTNTASPSGNLSWKLPPAATATNCSPSTENTDGAALTPAPHWNCHSTLPVLASYALNQPLPSPVKTRPPAVAVAPRSEEHTSELQSRVDLVCRLLLEKK